MFSFLRYFPGKMHSANNEYVTTLLHQFGDFWYPLTQGVHKSSGKETKQFINDGLTSSFLVFFYSVLLHTIIYVYLTALMVMYWAVLCPSRSEFMLVMFIILTRWATFHKHTLQNSFERSSSLPLCNEIPMERKLANFWIHLPVRIPRRNNFEPAFQLPSLPSLFFSVLLFITAGAWVTTAQTRLLAPKDFFHDSLMSSHVVLVAQTFHKIIFKLRNNPQWSQCNSYILILWKS